MKKYFALLIGLTLTFPLAFADVSIQNDQQYIGDDGAFHVVGEIQNNLEMPLNQVRVFVTLYDENQEIVATKDTQTMVNTIMPEMKGPFDFVFSDVNSTEIR